MTEVLLLQAMETEKESSMYQENNSTVSYFCKKKAQ